MPWEKFENADYRRLARNLRGRIKNAGRMAEVLLLSSKGLMPAQKRANKNAL